MNFLSFFYFTQFWLDGRPGNEYFYISHKISDLLTSLSVHLQWFETTVWNRYERFLLQCERIWLDIKQLIKRKIWIVSFVSRQSLILINQNCECYKLNEAWFSCSIQKVELVTFELFTFQPNLQPQTFQPQTPMGLKNAWLKNLGLRRPVLKCPDTKGQLISEWNLSKIWLAFWEIWRHQNFILRLTDL